MTIKQEGVGVKIVHGDWKDWDLHSAADDGFGTGEVVTGREWVCIFLLLP